MQPGREAGTFTNLNGGFYRGSTPYSVTEQVGIFHVDSAGQKSQARARRFNLVSAPAF